MVLFYCTNSGVYAITGFANVEGHCIFYFDNLDQAHFLQKKSIKFSPLTRYIWKYIRSNGGGWKNTHPHEAVMIENGQDNDTLMDTICEEWRRKWVTIVRVSSTTSFILGSSSTFWSTFKAKFLFTQRAIENLST